MKTYSLMDIERWRERTHRRQPRLRIRTKRQVLKFLDEVGFCFLFKTGMTELVCLVEALGEIPYGSTPATPRGRQASQWQIRSILPDETEAFRGKLLLRRPMLVSLRFLPFFIALSDRADGSVRSRLYGKSLTHTARLILENLQRRSPQTSLELRRRVAQSGSIGESAFELALLQLQTNLQIASLTASRSAIAGLWAPLQKYYGKQIRKARSISIEEARRALLEQHFRNQLVLTVADIRRLFRWERQEIFQTLGELIRRGIVTPEVQVEGIEDRTYCLLS